MTVVIKHMIDRNRALCNNEHVTNLPEAQYGETEFPCEGCRDVAVKLLQMQEVPEGDDLESKIYLDDTHDMVLASRVTLTEGNIAFLNLWLKSERSGGRRAETRPLYLVQTPWKIKHAREGDFVVRYREGVFDVWRPQRFLTRYHEL